MEFIIRFCIYDEESTWPILIDDYRTDTISSSLIFRILTYDNFIYSFIKFYIF